VKRYIIQNSEVINNSILLLTARPEKSKDRLSFTAGQYAAFGFENKGRPTPVRCFSIVNTPNQEGILQFALKIKGLYTSSAARKLRVGDTLNVHGPFGNFVVDTVFDRSIIMFAGGIGITPNISIIRFATEHRLTIPITLLYSVRHQSDIPFYEDLMSLQKMNPYFHVVFFISDDNVQSVEGTNILRGKISPAVIDQFTNSKYDMFTYFICGPSGFMNDISDTLLSKVSDPDRIVTEAFAQGSNAKLGDRFSANTLVYALTLGALVIGTGFIMALDLVRAVPKIAHAQALTNQQPATTASTNTTPTVSSSTPTTTSTDITSPTTTNNQSTSTPSSNSNSSTMNSYYQPAQTYQAPVTRIS